MKKEFNKKEKILILIFIFLFLLVGLITALVLTFENPTPENHTEVESNSVTIVVNSSGSENSSTFIDFDRSLVGYWSMDYYNSTGVYDNSSYNNFGTFKNALSISNISTGVRGQGIEFDGVNDYILPSINLTTNLNRQNITYSYWIKIKKPYSWMHPIGLWEGHTFTSYINSVGSLKVKVQTTTGSIDDATGDTLSQNVWYCITQTYNGTNVKVYLNGIETSNDVLNLGNINTTARTDIMTIGAYPTGAYVNASLDEVMVFNRTLSNSEILALYNSRANKFNVTFNNLSEGQHNYTIWSVDESGNFLKELKDFFVDFIKENLYIKNGHLKINNGHIKIGS